MTIAVTKMKPALFKSPDYFQDSPLKILWKHHCFPPALMVLRITLSTLTLLPMFSAAVPSISRKMTKSSFTMHQSYSSIVFCLKWTCNENFSLVFDSVFSGINFIIELYVYLTYLWQMHYYVKTLKKESPPAWTQEAYTGRAAHQTTKFCCSMDQNHIFIFARLNVL